MHRTRMPLRGDRLIFSDSDKHGTRVRRCACACACIYILLCLRSSAITIRITARYGHCLRVRVCAVKSTSGRRSCVA